jgi:SAM-dependent methyltransferase
VSVLLVVTLRPGRVRGSALLGFVACVGRPRRGRRGDRVRAMASGAEEFKAFEAAGWSRRASTYARVTGAITARFVDALLDAACVGAGMRVLDVATGPGHVAAAAAARGAEPVGVDIAEGMLAVARRDHPQLDFRHGDAEALPFADSGSKRSWGPSS